MEKGIVMIKLVSDVCLCCFFVGIIAVNLYVAGGTV